jgi:hypothetical protein
MRKNRKNLTKKESIVNLIANPHPVMIWGFPKKHLADPIKIVTSSFDFTGSFN